MAGLAERRGEAADSFWTWRDAMYRLRARRDPRRRRGDRRSGLCRDAGGGLHARSASSTTSTTTSAGAPYANRAEMAERIGAAAAETGIGLTLLPVFYAHAGFGGAPAAPSSAASSTISTPTPRSWPTGAARCGSTVRVGVAPHSLRAVTPEELAGAVALAGDRADPHPYRRADPRGRRLRGVVRRASGALAVRSRRRRSALVPRSRDPYRRRARFARSRGRARSWASARSPRPISATAYFRRRPFSMRTGGSASGRIPTSRSRSRENCACSNTRSASFIGRATSAPARRLDRRGAVRRPPRPAARRRSAGPRAALAPGAAADIVSLKGDSPRLAGRADDAILDAWIFGTGAGAAGDAIFFDRSPVCTLALSRQLGSPISAQLAAEVQRVVRHRVYAAVFFVRNQGFIEPTAARRIGSRSRWCSRTCMSGPTGSSASS